MTPGVSVRSSAPLLSRPRGEAGFSLIEMLVAVALVSILVLGLASGFLTMVRVNRATTEQQIVDQAVSNYSESLKAVPYLSCDSGNPDYAAVADLWAPTRAGMTVQVTEVEYWDPAAASADFAAACAAPSDAGAQRLTLRVEWNGRERRAQIVKRDRS